MQNSNKKPSCLVLLNNIFLRSWYNSIKQNAFHLSTTTDLLFYLVIYLLYLVSDVVDSENQIAFNIMDKSGFGGCCMEVSMNLNWLSSLKACYLKTIWDISLNMQRVHLHTVNTVCAFGLRTNGTKDQYSGVIFNTRHPGQQKGVNLTQDHKVISVGML